MAAITIVHRELLLLLLIFKDSFVLSSYDCGRLLKLIMALFHHSTAHSTTESSALSYTKQADERAAAAAAFLRPLLLLFTLAYVMQITHTHYSRHNHNRGHTQLHYAFLLLLLFFCSLHSPITAVSRTSSCLIASQEEEIKKNEKNNEITTTTTKRPLRQSSFFIS